MSNTPEDKTTACDPYVIFLAVYILLLIALGCKILAHDMVL
jgi:hypothetical protein